MSQFDMHLLFQQIGEVLNGIRALHTTADLRQMQAEHLHELLRADLATLRKDQRELEEKFECYVSVVQHEVDKLHAGLTENARSVGEIVEAVDALKRPVAEILGLKSRVAGLVFGAGIVGSGALWLAEPIYAWLVNTSFDRR